MDASSCSELRWFLCLMIMVLSLVASEPLIVASLDSSEPLLIESPDSSDYCTRRMAAKTCPTPPTMDNVDLRTFLGSYYEVGTSARYKLRNEGGLVCAHTNFSMDAIPPPQDLTSVVAIDIQNTGIQVVGMESVSAFSKISYSASDVCANAARMCAMMDTSSKLSEAVLRIGSVASDIMPFSPSDVSTLNQASDTINASVASVKTRLDGLVRCITVVSRIAAELSQGLGPFDALLRALRSTVTLASNEVHDLGTITIGNLTLTRNLIEQVMSHTMSANHVELLFEASTLIEQEIEVVTSQVSRIQGLLSSIAGPYADMIDADAVFTNTTETLVTEKCQVIQTPDERGNMVLKMKQMTQPYKIIALEGLPILGYSSVLVYSCKLNSNGDPAGDLILLSRFPTIPAPTISFLLSTATRYGISNDCDSVFVPTVQRGGDCGLPSH